MKKNKYILLVLIVILFINKSQAEDKNQDIYFKINKAFETYGVIFREVAGNYVESIDPEDLMQNGIDGMLSHLDPYTVYYKDNDNEIDVISNGSYVGIGISVATVDSVLTIVGITDGNPASKSGLRIGDKILIVDTTNVLKLSSDDLRKYTHGTIGSTIIFRVLRDNVNDTLSFTLKREDIKVNNVSFKTILNKDIAYIKVEKFSKLTANDFRTAFTGLKKKDGELKGLIIDLRNNPGGLLQSAVELCEMFLPQNSPIVTTRGRRQKEEFVFTSRAIPLDTIIPIVVLINQNSASASEIVAGALQDLDRAVVIGKRSFGKGLVQSVLDLPFNASLKITTAKYYIPSGRCIQRINYSKELVHGAAPKDSIFFTKNHRKVFESNGIEPDIKVIQDTLSDYVKSIYDKNLFFKFANTFSGKLDSIEKEFKIDDIILNSFQIFMKESGFVYEKSLVRRFDLIKQKLDEDKSDKKLVKSIEYFAKELEKKDRKFFDSNKSKIQQILNFEIKSRFLSELDLIEETISDDKDINSALDLFKTEGYYHFLSGMPPKGQN